MKQRTTARIEFGWTFQMSKLVRVPEALNKAKTGKVRSTKLKSNALEFSSPKLNVLCVNAIFR